MWQYCRCKDTHIPHTESRFVQLCTVINRCFPIFIVTFAADMNNGTFKVREYGRMELAQAYCPDIAPESAWKKLKKWIDLNPGLADRLRALGYDSHTRSFTPAQVQTIVDAIGEP